MNAGRDVLVEALRHLAELLPSRVCGEAADRITTLEAAVTAFLAAYDYGLTYAAELNTLRKLVEDGHGE